MGSEARARQKRAAAVVVVRVAAEVARRCVPRRLQRHRVMPKVIVYI